ncbi:LSU ribosomal protein L17p [Planctomycetales bacterium 10988]|nr:LSU ribosomal protein L17p [Planctomycetales bacterium 10988]
MRHRRRSRVLGRSPSHRKALLKNLTKSLILTEDPDAEDEPNSPKVKGRITTTKAKAKEVRSLVEKCITIAKKGIKAQEEAAQFATDAERDSSAWDSWRKSEDWKKWQAAMGPAVTARRRVVQLLSERGDKHNPGDKRVVRILFEEVAPRYMERPGGYTRVLELATTRLGDNGKQAILEFVGVRDRVEQEVEAPSFEDEGDSSEES